MHQRRARSREVYTLDEDEYEIVESEDSQLITSEEVLKKLDGRSRGPIEQEDFDWEDYTLSDYFLLEEGQYPRSLENSKGKLEGSMVIASAYAGGGYVLTQDPMYFPGSIVGISVANYLHGLKNQDFDLKTAFENSKSNWL